MTRFHLLASAATLLGIASPALAQQATTAAPTQTPPAATTAPATQTTTTGGAAAATANTASAAATPSVPAGGVTAGATVKDQAGGVVGTIDSVDASGAVLNTGKVKAKLGLNSFANTPTGPIIALTKDQLETQVTQQSGQALDAALKVGAVVRGPQGNQVGTVESITGDQVVVTTGKAKAQLAKAAFAASGDGLVIGLTQAQLEAAVAQGGKPAGG